MAEPVKRLRVTFVIDLDDEYGDLPEPKDCDDDTATLVCEGLLEMLASRALLYLGDPEQDVVEVELVPVGWSVEAGGYGDLKIGTMREVTP
jgi:hypothetical protein